MSLFSCQWQRTERSQLRLTRMMGRCPSSCSGMSFARQQFCLLRLVKPAAADAGHSSSHLRPERGMQAGSAVGLGTGLCKRDGASPMVLISVRRLCGVCHAGRTSNWSRKGAIAYQIPRHCGPPCMRQAEDWISLFPPHSLATWGAHTRGRLASYRLVGQC